MAFFDSLKNFIFEDEVEETEENPNVHTVEVSDSNATWYSSKDNTVMWQLTYALAVVQNLLSTVLTNVDWKTYKSGVAVKGEEWFRFNIAPNRRQTSAEFYSKLAEMLIKNGEALIIETAQKEFFVADSYSFKGEEYVMKDNTFIDVVIGATTLNRGFKENDSCMYIKLPQQDKVKAVFSSMGNDFLELKKLIHEGAEKALGMKLSLTLSAQGKNKYDEKYLEAVQKAYNPLMKKRDAVFVNYKGETLQDLTERQRGSEVQQVLEAVENNIKVNDEILNNVGMAYGIPNKFMNGDFTADNDNLINVLLTFFAKPILTLLSEKFTYFVLTREDIIAGGKVEADLNSIKFIEKLSMANAIDKLIGSGAYNINEVREMLDDDEVEDGDKRFITKNYALLSEYVKGGNSHDEV